MGTQSKNGRKVNFDSEILHNNKKQIDLTGNVDVNIKEDLETFKNSACYGIFRQITRCLNCFLQFADSLCFDLLLACRERFMLT